MTLSTGVIVVKVTDGPTLETFVWVSESIRLHGTLNESFKNNIASNVIVLITDAVTFQV